MDFLKAQAFIGNLLAQFSVGDEYINCSSLVLIHLDYNQQETSLVQVSD